MLTRRLAVPYGMSDTVRDWCSYLSGNHLKYVRSGSTRSTPTAMLFGVTQGSDPFDLLELEETYVLQSHNIYAEDTHIYGLCRPGSNEQLQGRVSACVIDVCRTGCSSTTLRKRKFYIYGSVRWQHQIPDDQ